MDTEQSRIAQALSVTPPFADEAALAQEVQHRIRFIQTCLHEAGCQVLVLGISGGVDSSTAGRLCQLAVEDLRLKTGNPGYRFIAVRLPHAVQHDEADAQRAMAFIQADQEETLNIAPAVLGLCTEIPALQTLPDTRRDFVLGNIKARMRMVAQYAIANAHNGLVVGTDHAAEAVMGFFTKYGDGACDLAPLTGLVKSQVRAIARYLGAAETIVHKVPTADLEELAPGKPDEDAHGVPYTDIDAFLHGQPVVETSRQRILDTYARTEHKRQLPKTP